MKDLKVGLTKKEFFDFMKKNEKSFKASELTTEFENYEIYGEDYVYGTDENMTNEIPEKDEVLVVKNSALFNLAKKLVETGSLGKGSSNKGGSVITILCDGETLEKNQASADILNERIETHLESIQYKGYKEVENLYPSDTQKAAKKLNPKLEFKNIELNFEGKTSKGKSFKFLLTPNGEAIKSFAAQFADGDIIDNETLPNVFNVKFYDINNTPILAFKLVD